ncbi:hypothetical protein GmHk_20G059229 [Glycine max]|nr:hypothetical protein GmHk_20G059229 [Glycine max]
MSEAKTQIESIRKWVVEHKLRTVGCLWLSGITGSIAYNWSRPNMKTSVKIIHARLHAQALTLGALAGAALVEYYDRKTGAKASTQPKYLELFIPRDPIIGIGYKPLAAERLDVRRKNGVRNLKRNGGIVRNQGEGRGTFF